VNDLVERRGTNRAIVAVANKNARIIWSLLAKGEEYWKNNLRGSALGTAIGALPGAGGDIAAWMSYALARRCSKTPEKFGTGHPEGVIEAGASNNAGLSGAWIPALVFGRPSCWSGNASSDRPSSSDACGRPSHA